MLVYPSLDYELNTQVRKHREVNGYTLKTIFGLLAMVLLITLLTKLKSIPGGLILSGLFLGSMILAAIIIGCLLLTPAIRLLLKKLSFLTIFPLADEYDIGYRFFKQHWGKGYATESAKAAMDYGFGTLKLDRIIGRARVENPASINVFNKLGMRFVEPYTENIQNWVLYEVVKEI